MKIIDSISAHTPHTPQAVFALWADPESWPTWDPEVRDVIFAGPPRLGARGRMRPASGPAASFTVTEYETDRLFTNSSTLPGARLVFEHRVSPEVGGSRIEVVVSVAGPLAGLWHRILQKSLNRAAHASAHGLTSHLQMAASGE